MRVSSFPQVVLDIELGTPKLGIGLGAFEDGQALDLLTGEVLIDEVVEAIEKQGELTMQRPTRTTK